MLEFKDDAICLSGLTGTKVKSETIGRYYPFWWKITSGGPRRQYSLNTAIVELNAATGEIYIDDTGETVLGSAGHALDLKVNTPHTEKLKIVLIENNSDCYFHLKKVIKRRWPSVSIENAEGSIQENTSNIYLLNTNLDTALKKISEIELGNTIYFFDPLRSVKWESIEQVASNRMAKYYQTGTEFLIFVFTSDWFLGRDDFVALPDSSKKSTWIIEEQETVQEADNFFGDNNWRNDILSQPNAKLKQNGLIEQYKRRLYKWFRYVLPLPFSPKQNQLFHLIFCSNYEAGITMTKNMFIKLTNNPKYSPDSQQAYRLFKIRHSNVCRGLRGNRRPSEWKILWKIITNHEGGRCDLYCRDLRSIERFKSNRKRMIEWLKEESYLIKEEIENAWEKDIPNFRLNWNTVKTTIKVDPPLSLNPLLPGFTEKESKEIRDNYWERFY